MLIGAYNVQFEDDEREEIEKKKMPWTSSFGWAYL